MIQGERVSLYEVATEFHSSSFDSPIYWSMLGNPSHLEEMASHLDSSECRYEPSLFEGLVISRPIANHCFAFLNHGAIVVVFTANSVEEAREAFADLEDYLVTISALSGRSGDTEEFSELPIATEEHDSAVSTSSNTLSATVDFDSLFDQIIYKKLVTVRDRYTYPERDLEIWLSCPDQESGSYKDNTGFGSLDIYQSDSRELYLGGIKSDDLGFVFEPDRVWYQIELRSPVHDATLNTDGSLVVAEEGEGTSTLRCFDSNGVELTSVSSSEMPLMALDSTTWTLCHTPDIANHSVIVRDIDTGAESSLEFDDQIKQIKWSPDLGGFELAVGGSAPSHILDSTGEVRQEIDRETPYGPTSDIVEALLGQPEDVWDALTAFNSATEDSPVAFSSHLETLIEGLATGEVANTSYSDAEEGFKNLASGIPEQVIEYVDQLLSLIENGQSPADTIAASTLEELATAGYGQNRIRAAIKTQLRSNDYRVQKRAAGIATALVRTENGRDEELIECLVDCLTLDQPVDLSVALFRALSYRKQDKSHLADTLVSRGKIDLLIKYTRRGSNDRNISNDLSLSFGTFEVDEDASSRETQPPVIDESSRGKMFYYLNKQSSSALSIVAEHHPESVLPSVGIILLDLLADGESMKVTRRNARDVLNTLVDQDPDGLSELVDSNVETLREVLENGDRDTQRCVIRLLIRGSTAKALDPIREISSAADHPLWEFTQAELRETDNQLADATRALDEGRLAHLSEDVSSIHLPTPAEIAAARTERGAQPKDIARQAEVHKTYVEALEDGRINPPLSVLGEIWSAVVGSQGGFDSFPTGTRCLKSRESQDDSIAAIAEQAGVDQARLRGFESESVDLTCYEVGNVLQALGVMPGDPGYPDRPTVRETWIDYVERLAEELGELPRSSDAVAYAAIDEQHNQVDGDATTEFGIPAETLPQLGHWSIFDGWNDVLNSLEIETEYRTSGAPLRENLVKGLQATAEAVDGVPTGADFERKTAFTTYNLKKEFGRLKAARAAAGVDCESQQTTCRSDQSSISDPSEGSSPSRSELTEAVQDLADALGDTPTTSQMNEEGAFSMPTYYEEFDTWNEALEAAGIKPKRAERSTNITREDLRKELQQLGGDLGRPPKTTDVKSDSEFSLGRYYNEYDSWSEALSDAGF